MPSWGILKTKKSKRSAHKVHFHVDEEPDLDSRRRSSSLDSQTSDGPLDDLPRDLHCAGRRHQPYLGHEDVQDEEERRCLRHLDQLGLALENTFKDVEILDAHVMKLRYNFDHELIPEKRFMSCMCSAKIARVACCKKQIELWQQLQHDMQTCCFHHEHAHEAPSHQCEANIESSDQPSDSDTSSVGTTCSHDTADMDFVLSQFSKMLFFDVIRLRLDPLVDSKTFVEHWVLNDQHMNHGISTQSLDSHTVKEQS